MNGSTSRPSSATMKGTRCAISPNTTPRRGKAVQPVSASRCCWSPSRHNTGRRVEHGGPAHRRHRCELLEARGTANDGVIIQACEPDPAGFAKATGASHANNRIAHLSQVHVGLALDELHDCFAGSDIPRGARCLVFPGLCVGFEAAGRISIESRQCERFRHHKHDRADRAARPSFRRGVVGTEPPDLRPSK